MERIDLFDCYVDGILSASERTEFENRLREDAEFAQSFRAYTLAVDGIRREAEQDDMDFFLAMQRLSKTELREALDIKAPLMTREHIIAALRDPQDDGEPTMERVSAAAALANSGEDRGELADDPEDCSERVAAASLDSEDYDASDDSTGSSGSLRKFTLLAFAIIIVALILLAIFL